VFFVQERRLLAEVEFEAPAVALAEDGADFHVLNLREVEEAEHDGSGALALEMPGLVQKHPADQCESDLLGAVHDFALPLRLATTHVLEDMEGTVVLIPQ